MSRNCLRKWAIKKAPVISHRSYLIVRKVRVQWLLVLIGSIRLTSFSGGEIMTNEYPRLCGGTFFTLLLQAIKQRTKARQRIAGERDGLSETDLLIGLIRVAYPEYRATADSSFKTNTSDYKKCKISTSSYLPFDWSANIEGFDKKVTADYQTPLHAMSRFVNNFI